MEDMDKKEIKEVIEWCDEKGHSEHEILDLIRRIVDAKPRNEEKPNEQAFRILNFLEFLGMVQHL